MQEKGTDKGDTDKTVNDICEKFHEIVQGL